MADVVVVGAGFAGLSAARDLVRLGHDVVVLEGRDRVGGRSSTTTIAGIPVDLGGTFVGPTQDAVIALARRAGLRDGADLQPRQEPDPVARQGPGVPQHHPEAVAASSCSTSPGSSGGSTRLTGEIPVAEPWTSPIAHRLDAKTLEQWLRHVHAGASTRNLMAIMARVTWGCEPEDVSMLHAVRYVKAAGGLGPDARRRGRRPAGPLPRRHPADRPADGRGARRPCACSNAVVRRIERHADGTLAVGSERGERRGQGRHRGHPARAPGRHRRSIPRCRPSTRSSREHWPQGNLSKAYAAYDTPFWRDGRLFGRGAV